MGKKIASIEISLRDVMAFTESVAKPFLPITAKSLNGFTRLDGLAFCLKRLQHRTNSSMPITRVVLPWLPCAT
jgi:hypothetical protein